jgi:chromosomal replication initiation ATPase DnaA
MNNKDKIIKRVREIVNEETGFDPFNSPKFRKREFVLSRHIFLTVLLDQHIMTYAQVGLILGKDHSSVSASKKAIQDLYDTDKEFRLLYDKIQKRVKMLK